MEKYFEIGQIVNTNGLKGILKVKPFTDDIQEFEKFTSIYIQKNGELIEFTIEKVRYVKNMVLLKLKGIDDINEAEKYKNLYIKIDREVLPTLPDNTFYIVDLIECDVETVDGKELGKIDDVFNTGSNDIYVVKNEEGKQILIPAIKQVIKKIDISNKRIIIELMEGLI